MQDGWHHVMNRGVDRTEIFLGDADRVEFGRLLGEASLRTGVEIHGYCLMPNHFHLIVCCPDGGLSDFVRHATAVYTRHLNDRVGRDGPLFRGRFHSLAIDTDDYLLAAIRYVHRNPLALLGVGRVDRYRWSSHRTYLGVRPRPSWMRTDFVLDMFDGDPARFHAFVSDVPTTTLPPAVQALASAVELVVDEMIDLARPRQGLARTLMLLAIDACDATGSSTWQSMGYSSARRFGQALWRARGVAASDPELLAAARAALELARSRTVPGTTRDAC